MEVLLSACPGGHKVHVSQSPVTTLRNVFHWRKPGEFPSDKCTLKLLLNIHARIASPVTACQP